jgi:hypothetical protein
MNINYEYEGNRTHRKNTYFVFKYDIRKDKMDVNMMIQGTIIGEMNRHLSNYPAFIRPLLGMIVGALLMRLLNTFLSRVEDKAEIFRDKWDSFWNHFGRNSENSLIFLYEDTKAEKESFTGNRCSPGFPELASFVMQQTDKAGECFRLSFREDTYIAKNLKNHRLYPDHDIFVDMDTTKNITDGVSLLRSKLIFRSRSYSIAELHKVIMKIIDDVNLNSHDGSLWGFMKDNIEGGYSFRRMKLNNNKNWDHLILNSQQRTILSTYLNRFQNKSWYLNMGIPYKATFLLYGLPGTGKTTIIKVLAEQYRRHVVLFSLKSLKNGEFKDLFYDYRFRNNMERFIYVFEDIDADTKAVWSREFKKSLKTNSVEDKDKDIEKSLVKAPEEKSIEKNYDAELTLATILQTLDGVIENTGLMVVATTNHYERLDPAFIRRFHCRLELSYCCQETANMIAQRFFGRTFTSKEWETVGTFVEKKTPNTMIELAISSPHWDFFLQELQK